MARAKKVNMNSPKEAFMELKKDVPTLHHHLNTQYRHKTSLEPVRLPKSELKKVIGCEEDDNVVGAVREMILIDDGGNRSKQKFLLLSKGTSIEVGLHEIAHHIDNKKHKVYDENGNFNVREFMKDEVDAWVWAEKLLGKATNEYWEYHILSTIMEDHEGWQARTLVNILEKYLKEDHGRLISKRFKNRLLKDLQDRNGR